MLHVSRRHALAALALIAATALPASAHQKPLEPGLATQIADFARSQGITPGAAARYFELTGPAGVVQERALATYPATFAGLWRTPADGGLLHVAFTRDAARSAREVTAGFPQPGLVRVHPARHSLRQLEAGAARITADRDALARAGTRVESASVDVAANAISVGVRSAVPSAASMLRSRYPHLPVHVAASPGAQPVLTACSRFACPLSLMGGVELTGGGFACTSGFAGVKSGRRVLVTAGHCFPSGTPVSNGSIPLGTVTTRVWGGPGDAELVQVDPDLPVLYAATNDVLWTEAGQLVSVLGVAGRTVSETVGAPVCRTGITTENRCGTIVTLNVTVTYTTGETVTGLTRTNACASPGDSGGPVMSGNNAFGLTSGAAGFCGVTSPVMYYMPAGRAESLLGALINTN